MSLPLAEAKDSRRQGESMGFNRNPSDLTKILPRAPSSGKLLAMAMLSMLSVDALRNTECLRDACAWAG